MAILKFAGLVMVLYVVCMAMVSLGMGMPAVMLDIFGGGATFGFFEVGCLVLGVAFLLV